MAYTEIKERNRKKYFYRVLSVRKNKKVSKKRIYLGVDLSKSSLFEKEKEADDILKVNRNRIQLNKIKQKIIPILKKNNIKKAGIFGSYATGEQKKNSDVDILIEPSDKMGFGFAGLEIQLAKALKKKIDLLSYNGISPYLRERILKQEVKII
jgi:predicted nucleotidyltransferase